MNKSVILLPILTTALILTSAADAGNDLIGWWKFDETSGSTAADYSGNGYAATVNKTNAWDAGGYDGGCLNFDGATTVSIPSYVFSNIDNEITILVWVSSDEQTQPASLFFGGKHLEVWYPWPGHIKFVAGGIRTGRSLDRLWGYTNPEGYQGRWNHYAFVKNGSEGIMRIYHNGELLTQREKAFKLISQIDSFFIGSYGNMNWGDCYEGKLDDFRIYNYALSQAEVSAIYAGSKFAKTMVTAVMPAKLHHAGRISEQSPKQEFLAPLHHIGSASGYETTEVGWTWWKLPQLGEGEVFGDGKYSINCCKYHDDAQMHGIELRVGGFAGDPTDPNVLFTWETASNSYDSKVLDLQIGPSKDRQVVTWTVPALILNSAGNGGVLQLVTKYRYDDSHDLFSKPYGWVGGSSNNGKFTPAPTLEIEIVTQVLGEWIKKADKMLAEREYKAAVKFIEEKLSEYSELHKQSDSVSAHSNRVAALTALHFRLAQAKEAVGASKEDITAIYQKVVESSHSGYFLQEQIAAMIWLLANKPQEQHSGIVSSFVKNNDIGRDSPVLTVFARQCEKNGNWDTFKGFLDLIFLCTKDPVAWAKCFERGLRRGPWKQRYLEYCSAKPQLIDYAADSFFEEECNTAERYIKQGKYEQAIEIFQNLVEKCNSAQRKAVCELEICKCLFEQGDYKKVISQLNRFIMDNKASVERASVEEAILIKGKSYAQLGELDKALDTFLSLSVEYPKAKEGPEINFFIGYCYMLQSKFKQATEVFNLITKDYPQSGYASKAKLCLTRIENMIK